MRVSRFLLLLVLTACVPAVCGAAQKWEPHIGYVFPAGGQQGRTFEVLVGGQFLRGVTDAYVSGGGVSARVVQHCRPPRNLDREQRQELRGRLEKVRNQRLAELDIKGWVPPLPGRPAASRSEGPQGKEAEQAVPVELPAHPLLRNLEDMSLRQLENVADQLLNWRYLGKRQMNTQLADMVLVEVTVDPDAEPGDRELRLATPRGLTNPMCFQVGTLPEVREQEPDDSDRFAYLPKEPPIDLPMVLNGQIMPGDIDRFRFRARRGQQLVVETHARRLAPFLADAVPGWFQATVALYDAKGHEVAFADDYRFHPDPVLFYQIPEDGEYELEIRDSIYRGREDFVYRVAVGELPFITQTFPLGGRMGVSTVAAIDGWNLASKRLRLDTQPGDDHIRQTALRENTRVSNEVVYAVDTLPECIEIEPNDDTQSAQRIDLPRIVNGRIARPGDVDVFQFEGRAGDEVVAEVLARRLHSPLDSLLRVTDARGSVLEWNDDYMQKDGQLHRDMGSLTHHADSCLSARLPEDGTYYVHLADAQNHGGEAYGYRLRIAPPRPDFALRMTPSSLSMRAGTVAPFTVHVLRRDGFEGDVELVLKDAPAGFALSGGRVPSGRDRVRMTLAAPREPVDQRVALQLEGRAGIGGKTVGRPVLPSEDVMQAFLYRHLVPSQELTVVVRPTRWRPLPVELVGLGPVRVPAGGTAPVRLNTPRLARLGKIELELWEPPEGITLQDVRAVPGGLAFQLKVEGEAVQAGFAGNLIVEVFRETEVKKEGEDGAKPATQTRRVSLGVLPAIPFVVVQP